MLSEVCHHFSFFLIVPFVSQLCDTILPPTSAIVLAQTSRLPHRIDLQAIGSRCLPSRPSKQTISFRVINCVKTKRWRSFSIRISSNLNKFWFRLCRCTELSFGTEYELDICISLQRNRIDAVHISTLAEVGIGVDESVRFNCQPANDSSSGVFGQVVPSARLVLNNVLLKRNRINIDKIYGLSLIFYQRKSFFVLKSHWEELVMNPWAVDSFFNSFSKPEVTN